MTCCTSLDWWIGSGSSGRTPPGARRGIRLLLLGLDAVLRAGLLAVGHAGRVERPAHDLVAHARQVLHSAAAHEHHRVLLQVVALARDVGGDLHPVGEPHPGHLPKRRVRLLRGDRVHARADPAPLRRGDALLATLTGLQTGGRDLLAGLRAALAYELVDAGHAARDGSSGIESASWGWTCIAAALAPRSCSFTASDTRGAPSGRCSRSSRSGSTSWRWTCRDSAARRRS